MLLLKYCTGKAMLLRFNQIKTLKQRKQMELMDFLIS